ncbi:hypothetical protein [Sorangium sp. So ce117]|uniref:hypothetical protein n=1 Tax=Sorangium sp. So ce117 TaxID=3133277 RepID=UPI003F628B1A
MIQSRSLFTTVVIAAASAGLSACFRASPPSAWARGGAFVEVSQAEWMDGSSSVQISMNGEVTANGAHLFTIDRAGRVTRSASSSITGDEQPYALLDPSGYLIGPNDERWGFVGVEHAYLPGKTTPWIVINPAGYVIHYDEDGAEMAHGGGRWYGCRVNPRTQQSCTLVTYLIRLEKRLADDRERMRSSMPRSGDRP